MLFASITRRCSVSLPEGVRRADISLNSHHVTLAVDGRMGRLSVGDGELTAVEAAGAKEAGASEFELVRASVERATRTLRISRLTCGGRPLYYTVTQEGQFFCSTHVSMLRRVGVPLTENAAALPEFLVYCFVTPPETLFKGISQVPYGQTLVVALRGDTVVVRLSGASFGIAQPPPLPDDGWDGPVSRTLMRTFELLSGSRDHVATLLSGGMDSSILTALASRVLGIRRTYSTSYPFEDPGQDVEEQYALSAAAALGVNHSHHRPTVAEYLHGLLDAIAAAEEPLHGLQTVLLGCLFRRGLEPDRTLVVCGQGADGLMGLPLHEAVRRARENAGLLRYLSFPPIPSGIRLLAAASGRGHHLLSRVRDLRRYRVAISDTNSVIWDLQRYGSEDWVRAHFGVAPGEIIANRLRALAGWAGRDLLDLISLLDLTGDIAAVQSLWSKIAESHGRTVVYPFTSPELIEYLLGVPWSVKLSAPKALAQGVARCLQIPDFIVSRPKSSFGVRASRWANPGGPFEPLVPLVAPAVPESLIREVQSPREDLARIYWNLLNYAIWRRLVVDGEPLDSLHAELDSSSESLRPH
ncbi:MAG: hypothetical protein HY725_09260 [Candidatus Rokubacteria bacterium]|nr:hypothetical protein [Candidatus Rokubacteria bacterium]